MILVDVNVLVYAFRSDAVDHERYKGWLEAAIVSDSAFAMSELVLSGFLRIVTHPRIFDPPAPLEAALSFAAHLRERQNAIIVSPGPRHWDIFTRVCESSGAKGNLIPDAYHAALAIESGCEWITTDRDFARFPGLNWRHPFDAHGT